MSAQDPEDFDQTTPEEKSPLSDTERGSGSSDASIEPAEGPAWYVVHCYSGYENKVKKNLEHRIASMGMQSRIFETIVPTEEQVELKEGQRRIVERRIYPGYVLVKMTDAAGGAGWGEAPALKDWGGDFGRYFGESPGTTIEVITRYLAPAVKGGLPGDIAELHARMDRSIKGYPFAKAAVEFPAYDLAGRQWGLPVHRLLGGAVRRRIPVTHSIGLIGADEAEREVMQVAQEGVRTIKIKVGVDPDRDVEMVRRIRETVGQGVALCVDANQGYRTPARTLRRLAAGSMIYESPGVARGDWDRFAVRNLGLAVNRRMAEKFGGDARRMRRVAGDGLKLVLSLIPGLDAEQILKAKSAREEVNEVAAREALRRQLRISQFETLRQRLMPFAEARGYLTDEDVFAEVS